MSSKIILNPITISDAGLPVMISKMSPGINYQWNASRNEEEGW